MSPEIFHTRYDTLYLRISRRMFRPPVEPRSPPDIGDTGRYHPRNRRNRRMFESASVTYGQNPVRDCRYCLESAIAGAVVLLPPPRPATQFGQSDSNTPRNQGVRPVRPPWNPRETSQMCHLNATGSTDQIRGYSGENWSTLTGVGFDRAVPLVLPRRRQPIESLDSAAGDS